MSQGLPAGMEISLQMYVAVTLEKLDEDYDKMVRIAYEGWQQDHNMKMFNSVLDGAKSYFIDGKKYLESRHRSQISTGGMLDSCINNVRTRSGRVSRPPQNIEKEDAAQRPKRVNTCLGRRKRTLVETSDSEESFSDAVPSGLHLRKRTKPSPQGSKNAEMLNSSAGLPSSDALVSSLSQTPHPAKGSPTTPKRVTRACHTCRRKKIKCGGKQPCVHCAQNGHDCIYGPTVKTVSSAQPNQASQPSKLTVDAPTAKQPSKVARACHNCRTRKTKCDGKPTCSQCSRSQKDCTYDRSSPSSPMKCSTVPSRTSQPAVTSSSSPRMCSTEPSQTSQPTVTPSKGLPVPRLRLVLKSKVTTEKLASVNEFTLKEALKEIGVSS